jgi:hypothetical protein
MDGLDSIVEIDWKTFDDWMNSGTIEAGPYTNEFVQNMQENPMVDTEKKE